MSYSYYDSIELTKIMTQYSRESRYTNVQYYLPIAPLNLCIFMYNLLIYNCVIFFWKHNILTGLNLILAILCSFSGRKFNKNGTFKKYFFYF